MLLVDVDFLKEQGPETHDASTSRSQSQRCQLIHLVVDSVKVLDAASLPPRKKAVEQEKVKSLTNRVRELERGQEEVMKEN